MEIIYIFSSKDLLGNEMNNYFTKIFASFEENDKMKKINCFFNIIKTIVLLKGVYYDPSIKQFIVKYLTR